jgi:hypothetical protein
MASIDYVIMMVKAGEPLTISAISTPRKTKKTADIVAPVAATEKEDWRITCKDITCDHGGGQIRQSATSSEINPLTPSSESCSDLS